MSVYRDTLRSRRWKALKRVRLARAGWRCERCGWQWFGRSTRSAPKSFELHHVTYARVGSESVHDVRALCKHCHRAVHNRLGEEVTAA